MRRFGYFASAVLAATSGCYSVQPVATSKPAPGTRLEMSITDEGRAALGGTMGPEIRRVEGNLLSQQDGEYVLSVIGVNYLNGLFQPWKGETVRIKANLVSGLYEKRFSTGRTIMFVAAATAVGFALAPRAIKSSLPEEEPPPPTGYSSRRPTVMFRFGLPR